MGVIYIPDDWTLLPDGNTSDANDYPFNAENCHKRSHHRLVVDGVVENKNKTFPLLACDNKEEGIEHVVGVLVIVHFAQAVTKLKKKH